LLSSLLYFFLQHVHCTIFIHNHYSLSNKDLIGTEGVLRLPTTIPVTGVSDGMAGRADLILQGELLPDCCREMVANLQPELQQHQN